MATKIRSEISKKKMYWLPKHRQLELVHFCLQYPDWKMRLATLDGYSGRSSSVVQIPEKNGTIWKPVERIVEERMMLEMKIRMVESAAYEAANDLYEYLLKGVTQGVGYEMLNVPCYVSVNHPVDRDPVCGYNGIIGDVCPSCGRRHRWVETERMKRLLLDAKAVII